MNPTASHAINKYRDAVIGYIDSQKSLYLAIENEESTKSTNQYPKAAEAVRKATAIDIEMMYKLAMEEKIMDHMVALDIAEKL